MTTDEDIASVAAQLAELTRKVDTMAKDLKTRGRRSALIANKRVPTASKNSSTTNKSARKFSKSALT